MYLVDEDDYVWIVLQFCYYGTQAFLELSAVLCSCYNSCHVERYDALVEQHARGLSLYNALCKPLYDGRLADTRLAYKYGVVLLATAQYLRDAFYLLLTPYNRVELALACCLCHVEAEVVEDRCVVRRFCLLCAGIAVRVALAAPRQGVLIVVVLVGETETVADVAAVGGL